MFDSGLILNYRSGRDWCDVRYLLHPQLIPSDGAHPEDIWAEMRLHMEWSEGFSLCVLFFTEASATEQIVQWADDAWAWRIAP